VKVLDLDEGARALRDGIVGTAQISRALETLDGLLRVIYAGGFPELAAAADGLWGEN
jgi:predicted RNA-binding protein associated with RNAse of E/G family